MTTQHNFVIFWNNWIIIV